MQRLRLVGRYKMGVKMPCHFEDIPVFLKMADLGKDTETKKINNKQTFKKDNISYSNVIVTGVKEGSYIITSSPIVRWKIVSTMHNKLVLAYRTYLKKSGMPYIYKIKRMGNNVFLRDVSTIVKPDGSRRNGFDRLKMYYDYHEAGR